MTIQAREFLVPAQQMGFTFWAGVPCSFLKPFINCIISSDGLTYVSSANEGDAVAAATGAALAGQKSVVMMQNSGLGNAVSPLSSLNWVFRIPVLLIITLRGDPELADEPQHELMGLVTTRLLDTLDIRWHWFPDHGADLVSALDKANTHMDSTGLPFAFIMRKGTVEPFALTGGSQIPARRSGATVQIASDTSPRPSRQQVLQDLVRHTDPETSVLIGSTGYNGRELFAIDDRPNHLYMVGSMGCAASLGLGISMTRPALQTVVVDGDGGALMRMGNLATVGNYAGNRFFHLILDNGVHESTGGQATVSDNVNFAAVAAACNYAAAIGYQADQGLKPFLAYPRGPALMHVKTATGTPAGLPRPSMSPALVKQRLMRQLGVRTAWADAGT